MSGFEPDVTSHGNYKCPYCTKRKVAKIKAPMVKHIAQDHLQEAKLSEAESSIKRLRIDKAGLERRIEVLTKPLEKQKEYYDAIVYCSNCRAVYSWGMPKGSLTENVTCATCGLCKLGIVTNISKYWTK